MDTSSSGPPPAMARPRGRLAGCAAFSLLPPNPSPGPLRTRPAAAARLGNLRRMRVVDVAIPRAEIVALADDAALDAVVEVFRDSGLTRLPVYAGTLDHPAGFVHLKDLALKHGFNGRDTEFDLRSMARPLLFVPPSMPIEVLLDQDADRPDPYGAW